MMKTRKIAARSNFHGEGKVAYCCFEIKRTKGFSLLELMIAMVLSLFLIGGVVATYLAGRTAALDATQLSRVQENIRFASDYLVRDIRNAGFSDEGELLLDIARQIRESYVDVLSGDSGTLTSVPSGMGPVLRVRYVGLGHCAQEFQTLRLVENEYSVSGGLLQCRGRQVTNTLPNNINSAVWSDPVPLVAGVTRVSFERVCPDGVVGPCSCDLEEDVESACVGVRIAMEFDGPGGIPRSVELLASLRNVVFARMNAGFPPVTSPGGG